MSPVGGERGAGRQGGGGVTVPAGMSGGAGAEILVEHLSEKHRGGPRLTPPRGVGVSSGKGGVSTRRGQDWGGSGGADGAEMGNACGWAEFRSP